jgi:hypothetical protein
VYVGLLDYGKSRISELFETGVWMTFIVIFRWLFSDFFTQIRGV